MEGTMRIAIGADHAGYRLKTAIVDYLARHGHQVEDFGTSSEAPVDYPDFVHPAAAAVSEGRCERGIVLGGSGNGEAITANRHRGVRCVLCWDEESARLGRRHNDANVLSLGARMMPEADALRLVEIWLTTEFEGGRHLARIRKIDAPA
jgi:ribose 5-phosphate isomerase B